LLKIGKENINSVQQATEIFATLPKNEVVDITIRLDKKTANAWHKWSAIDVF
jgi:hypothetical protein